MDLSLKTTQATISNKENLKSLRKFRMSGKVYEHQKTSVIVRQSNGIAPGDNRSSGGRHCEEKQGDNSLVECPICGEVTINHSHYGGVVCDSCKAFFRRTVVNPSKKSERCRLGNGRCSLKAERRNNCPFCRFKLCLQTGMKPEMIKIRISPAKASTEAKKGGRLSPANADLAGDQIEQILKFHKYILTQTSGVNLMTIPGKYLSLVDDRISSGANSKDENQDTISIALLECNFLKVKQKLCENQKDTQHILRVNDSGSKIFTLIQELILELIIIFMKQCRFFQALTWDCTSRLLRKNITDITVLLLMMSYDREQAQFRCLLADSSPPVEVDRLTLTRYFGPEIAADIFQLEIPGHVLIVMILICLYSRGGMPMKKQEKIDGARNFYQQLLFRYIKGTNSEDISSRFNATLHRALKSVNDFGEKMRSFQIFNIHTNIQSI